ncbi:hypothetical protein Tco_0400620 [Tanacetum coccineum]
MDTLSLVSEYLKDLEECIDDGDSRVAKEAKLFDALEHKSVVIEVDNQKIAIFTKAPLRAFGEPFTRYSLPCKVDRQGAWDAELDLADSANYVTEKVLENMDFVHASLSNYGRKMVNDVNVEIHGLKFKADFVVLDYVNEGEPSILFGRDFLATTKSQVDFGLGEIWMNLTKFKKGIDVIDLLEEVGSLSEEVVKMGKANHNKGYNINKLAPPPTLKVEEILPTSIIPPQLIYHPLTPRQNEKMKGKERLNKKEFSEEDKVGIIEHGLPKKMCDPRNYVLPVKINGVVEMVALVDTGASVSVLPYSLYKDLGLGDPRPYQTNLTMVDNTQAKATGEVKNVRIQIGYQAYVVDLLILDILERSFGVPRVANWCLVDGYGFEDILREIMKLEYIYEGDGDIFVDYSWERALSIDNEIYPEWVLEFFSTLYFDKDVDRNNLMKEKCIWFDCVGMSIYLHFPSL